MKQAKIDGTKILAVQGIYDGESHTKKEPEGLGSREIVKILFLGHKHPAILLIEL